MTKKKTKIIIATILLTGLVLMLACIINIVYIYFDDPWKDGHTEAYLDYVEWNFPFELTVSYSELELLGKHKETKRQYYAIDGFSSEELIAVVEIQPSLFGPSRTLISLYYNPETVTSPEELFHSLSADFFPHTNPMHTDVVPISDEDYVRQLIEDLLRSEPMTEYKWKKLNTSYTYNSHLAEVIIYLNHSEHIQIRLRLYWSKGVFFWGNQCYENSIFTHRYVPLDEALFDIVGDF